MLLSGDLVARLLEAASFFDLKEQRKIKWEHNQKVNAKNILATDVVGLKHPVIGIQVLPNFFFKRKCVLSASFGLRRLTLKINLGL